VREPAGEPLFRWAHQRDAWLRSRARVRRRLALGALGCGVLLASALLPPRLRLVWNVSASAPTGLYLVWPGASPSRGATAIARVPARFRAFAAARGYLPANVPLVKRVAAAAPDSVCALGPNIFVNGKRVATRLRADRQDRLLPQWHGCIRLRRGEYLLLMPHADSFDGRYFGVTLAPDMVGRARLLWAR
jgi:type IV secretory pathway protease TraF